MFPWSWLCWEYHWRYLWRYFPYWWNKLYLLSFYFWTFSICTNHKFLQLKCCWIISYVCNNSTKFIWKIGTIFLELFSKIFSYPMLNRKMLLIYLSNIFHWGLWDFPSKENLTEIQDPQISDNQDWKFHSYFLAFQKQQVQFKWIYKLICWFRLAPYFQVKINVILWNGYF